jgi:hypothetical protein
MMRFLRQHGILRKLFTREREDEVAVAAQVVGNEVEASRLEVFEVEPADAKAELRVARAFDRAALRPARSTAISSMFRSAGDHAASGVRWGSRPTRRRRPPPTTSWKRRRETTHWMNVNSISTLKVAPRTWCSEKERRRNHHVDPDLPLRRRPPA